MTPELSVLNLELVGTISVDGALDAEWQALCAARREVELGRKIPNEHSRAGSACELIETVSRHGAPCTTCEAIAKVLPTGSRFGPAGGHGPKKRRMIQKIGTHFEPFLWPRFGGDE